MKKALIIIGIIVVVGGVAGFLFWQDYKSGVVTGEVNLAGEKQADEGREHVPEGTQVAYKTNPPSSGNHYATPAAWGVYTHELDDRQLVHNLEHGGIWISYKPEIDADSKAKIEDIGSQYPQAVIVTPRAANGHMVEVVSWNQILHLDSFDRDAIIDFIKRNKNHSPEPLAR